MKIVVAHGTFDILHYGHINYLEKAKSFGDYLIVLVTSDTQAKIQNKKPYFEENIRLRMISSIKYVNKVVLRNGKITNELLSNLNADVFVTTDSNFKKYLKDNIDVKIIDRTDGISSTVLKKYIINEK